MAKDKLSPVQECVMTLLCGGLNAYQMHGSAFYINGKRVCNLDTMTVLERKGLAERAGRFYWRATEKGRVSDGK